MSAAPPRFLADESCDFSVVRALRAQAFDVVAVSEQTPGAIDRELIREAHAEQRILITEDNDFGWLVFVSHVDTAGVILIRFPGDARKTLAATIVDLVQEQAESLPGAFVVVQPGHVRLTRRPSRDG
jgi:predicted nuclease of predicted toxin-antitoxin system